ncbi:hypothetical protein [Coralloluteibacterium thermophilus]|uniref:Uncharacterized protein n=1 Tax=Coralloluteibacterium thermophilum TaxID=2707049 RepID=A0ABV9NKT9_9GAMM
MGKRSDSAAARKCGRVAAMDVETGQVVDVPAAEAVEVPVIGNLFTPAHDAYFSRDKVGQRPRRILAARLTGSRRAYCLLIEREDGSRATVGVRGDADIQIPWIAHLARDAQRRIATLMRRAERIGCALPEWSAA